MTWKKWPRPLAWGICDNCKQGFRYEKRRNKTRATCKHCGHEQVVGTKYGAKKERCRLQHTHDSGMEAEYCAILQIRKRAGEIIHFEYGKEYKMQVGGELFIHKPDFTIYEAEANPGCICYKPIEVHEVKGFEKMEWRLKRAIFRLLYPKIKYITIKKIRGRWVKK